jgi:repressor LexA
VLAEENIEDYVPVPEIAGGEQGQYVLRVHGDSMKNAGILDGDTVVVRKQPIATDGDIVVAIVGGDDMEAEATVKRYFRERDHIRLEPENESFEPIRSPDVKVAGRVIGVFRRVT